jgi:hypothetical protein
VHAGVRLSSKDKADTVYADVRSLLPQQSLLPPPPHPSLPPSLSFLSSLPPSLPPSADAQVEPSITPPHLPLFTPTIGAFA